MSMSSIARLSHGGGTRALVGVSGKARRAQTPLLAAAALARYVSSRTPGANGSSGSSNINNCVLPSITTSSTSFSSITSHHHCPQFNPAHLPAKRMQLHIPSISGSLLTLAAAGALTSYLTSSSQLASSLLTNPARRFFSTSTANMSGSAAFMEAVAYRRTNYELKKTDLPIDDAKIKQIVEQTITTVPSSFNAQSTRLVVLLKAEHDKFWDFVLEVLQPHITDANRGHTEGRIHGFKAAYGSILFFENPDPVNALKKQFPQYEDRFGPWSEHTSAMHQFTLWTALSAEGLGANLQHYNPLVDSKAKEEWKVPGDWSLKAQLVFGAKAGKQPEPKDRLPVSETVFIHGA